MRWRLLPFSVFSAAMNMAIDEAVSEGIRDGDSPPTIRFYRWQPSAVSIGRFQALHDEVNVEECRRQGIDVVRRRTGGGAVFHDHDGEVTYSVIAPESVMGADIQTSYREVCGWVIDALSELGLNGEYRPINDITIQGRKISGCAQSRREGIFLQHGTVLYSLDRERMFSLLKIGAEKSSDKAISAPSVRVTAVSEMNVATMEDLLHALQRSFCRGKDCDERALTNAEEERAAGLIQERYGNPDWTNLR